MAAVIHPFAEHIAYYALFAIPLLTTAFTGTVSILGATLYVTYLDTMNNLGHCNFELIPKSLFDMFPPLKYIMYTPSTGSTLWYDYRKVSYDGNNLSYQLRNDDYAFFSCLNFPQLIEPAPHRLEIHRPLSPWDDMRAVFRRHRLRLFTDHTRIERFYTGSEDSVLGLVLKSAFRAEHRCGLAA
ncbi:hypothetical protein Tco_0858776 [Tanacetum coccineum]|uniref:Uncharacterized protein n=1 Tax=Tanacetum coccineum TaxID=301880 RepID=A0ABQ5BBX7_9ASTR